MRSILRFIAIFMLASPGVALATPMIVTVTGIVNSSYDMTGNFFASGLGANNSGYDSIIGKDVSIRYSFDTATVPPDTGASGNDSLYSSGGMGVPAWLAFDATLSGAALPDVVQGSGDLQNFGVAAYFESSTSSGASYQGTSILVSAEDMSANSYGSEDSSFYFNDFLMDMLDGYGLDQTFSLQSDGLVRFGQGHASWRMWSFGGPVLIDEQAWLNFDVTSVTAAKVSEPSGLLLLGAALGGLLAVRRRKPDLAGI